MILSQTDLILRAIQVTSLWATALGEDTPGASTELFAPLEQGKTTSYQEQSRIQGTEPRSHEQRTENSQKEKSLANLAPKCAGGNPSGSSLACRDTEHLQPLHGTGWSPALWKNPGDLGLSQTCCHLCGPRVPIQARISCTETKITFSKASCSETLQ